MRLLIRPVSAPIVLTIIFAFVALVVASFECTSSLNAQDAFSIDATSVATSTFTPGDILAPGARSRSSRFPDRGIRSVVGAEIDGLSDGMDFGTHLLFSVDNASIGIAGTDVSIEFAGGAGGAGDHPADIFFNPLGGFGTNFIFRDGNGIANPLLAPGFGLTEPFPTPGDNVDAYNFGPLAGPFYGGPIYFTVGAASPAGLATDAIHLVSSPGSAISTYVAGSTLSLLAADDIDAIFVLDDGDGVFSSAADVVGFSLDRLNPSLTAGTTLSTLYAGGTTLSAADVFILTGTGGSFYVPAASHGLIGATDNIDALDQINIIPEPGSIGLLGVFAVGMLYRRKK